MYGDRKGRGVAAIPGSWAYDKVDFPSNPFAAYYQTNLLVCDLGVKDLEKAATVVIPVKRDDDDKDSDNS
jgi:hypothetical protein